MAELACCLASLTYITYVMRPMYTSRLSSFAVLSNKGESYQFINDYDMNGAGKKL